MPLFRYSKHAIFIVLLISSLLSFMLFGYLMMENRIRHLYISSAYYVTDTIRFVLKQTREELLIKFK